MDNVLKNYFAFSTFIEKLKKIERFKGQFYWRDYPELQRYESVADHSWRLAILVLLFSDKLSQPFNTEKALKMALLHDLPEVIAGDMGPMEGDGTGNKTYANNPKLKQDKFNFENDAAKNLFSMLPKDKAKELYDLWVEYENRKCFEAKVVKAFDRLECSLQVLEYRKGSMFKKHHKFNLDYGFRDIDVDPAIEEFGETIANVMKKRYKEYKNEK
jgi:putative hydrolases of HD superfamily